MRVGILGYAGLCDPNRIGGYESFIRRLAHGLLFELNLVTIVLSGADEDRMEERENGLKVLFMRSFTDALECLEYMDLDHILEFTTYKSYYLEYLMFRRRLKGVKFSTILLGKPEGKIKSVVRNWIRTLGCHRVFAASPRLVRELKTMGILAFWLPPPVPNHYFADRSKRHREKNITYVGRIDPNKGVDQVLDVYRDLIAGDTLGSVYQLGLYGYCDSKSKESVALHTRLRTELESASNIQYQVQQLPEHHSAFYSRSDERRLLELLHRTDILVLPYRSLEGTLDPPLLVLEGLAAKCVVVSSDVGSIPELIAPAFIAKDQLSLLEIVRRVVREDRENSIVANSLLPLGEFATSAVISGLVQCLQESKT